VRCLCEEGEHLSSKKFFPKLIFFFFHATGVVIKIIMVPC